MAECLLYFKSPCPGGEMADTPDLGSGAARRGGSSPFLGKLYFLKWLM
jgi:hypothetical protein